MGALMDLRRRADISLMRHSLHRLAAIALAVAFLCSSAATVPAGRAGTSVTRVSVTEKDFRIAAPRSAPAGELLLTVANKGPDNHELVIVRKTGARLPFRSDGLTVDEDALDAVRQPSLEPGAPSSVRMLRLRLRPGRYVLFCNMSGHFLAGMRTELVVR